MLKLYEGLRGIPAISLRSDLNIIPLLLGRYFSSLLQMVPHLGTINRSVGEIMDLDIRDP